MHTARTAHAFASSPIATLVRMTCCRGRAAAAAGAAGAGRRPTCRCTCNECLLHQRLLLPVQQVTQQAQVTLGPGRAAAQLLRLLRSQRLCGLRACPPGGLCGRHLLQLLLLLRELGGQLLHTGGLLLVGCLEIQHPLYQLLRPAQPCEQVVQLTAAHVHMYGSATHTRQQCTAPVRGTSFAATTPLHVLSGAAAGQSKVMATIARTLSGARQHCRHHTCGAPSPCHVAA